MPLPNLHRADPPLRKHLARRLPPEAMERAAPLLDEMGGLAADPVDRLARDADRFPPRLARYDARGERVDRVEHHPSYDAMRDVAYGFGLVWRAHAPASEGGLPRVAVFALSYLFAQAEQGLYCPVCLTDGAAVLVDRYGSEAARELALPRLLARERRELWEGAMFLTEKGGGSDVGGGTATVARLEGGEWRLHGDKWFCSNAGAEAWMVLARPEGAAGGTEGLALFMVPRALEDGSKNRFRVERLKDKLGTRSMATGEIVLDGARAHLLGGPGEGFRQMADMLNLSRVHNAVASAAVARRALVEAVRHAREREAFGKRLEAHPLQRAVLADMAVEWEASLVLALEAAAALQAAWGPNGDSGQPGARLRMRLLTPLAKVYTAKAAVALASEACEALGGNGYVEEQATPRLLRDAQVLPIWEGTTNVLSLDAVLRGCLKERAHEALLSDLRARLAAAPVEAPRVAAELDALEGELAALAKAAPEARELKSRRLAFRLAEATCAALLAEAADDGRGQLVAAAYAEKRYAPREWAARDRAATKGYELVVDGALPRDL